MDMNKLHLDNDLSHSGKSISIVLVLICIYMFLTIERPWESISYFNNIRIERLYAVVLIFIALIAGRLRLSGVPTDKWVLALLVIHFILAPFAYISSSAFDQGIEYVKMAVMYFLFLSCCDDEADLKFIVKAFVITMGIYVLHSFWEFTNGRYTYRMGIIRMLGVGDTYSDPNSFAASIVLSLPFAWVVFKSESNIWFRRSYITFALLGVSCIVLTGSRSGMLALLFLISISVVCQKGSKRFKLAAFMIITVFLAWSFIPSDKQERIRSVWDEEAGPENAHQSMKGRSLGFHAGIEMFFRNPLTGIGAGSTNFIRYRLERLDGIPEQAHNLIGEVLGELGIPGAFAFIGLIASSSRLFWKARKLELYNGFAGSFLHRLSGAGLITLVLLVFLGLGGHNFYRPMWLWLASWASLVHLFAQRRIIETQENAVEDLSSGSPAGMTTKLNRTY